MSVSRADCLSPSPNSTLTKETARATAAAVSGVVAAVVAANIAAAVGASIASAVAGSTGGGAVGGGAGSASGGGGACATLIMQVQFLNLVGKVGGDDKDENFGAFTDGFGWANLQFGLFGDTPASNSTDVQGTRRQKQANKTAIATDDDADDICAWSEVMPGLEQLTTCGMILLVVSLCRKLVEYFITKVLRKGLPQALAFPAWEGPVFITEYVGICEGCVLAMQSHCSGFILIGSVLFVGVPLIFLALATIMIFLHTRHGNLKFEPAPKPAPMKVAVRQALKAPTLFQKLLAYRYWKETTKTSGEWVCKNEKLPRHNRGRAVGSRSSRWTFVIQDFNVFWIFSIWILTKKTLLTLLLSLTSGSTNAWIALITQGVDTALVIGMKPYSEIAINNNEIWSGLTNLITFLNVTAPLLWGERIVGSIVGNPLVSMALSLLATGAALLTSVLELLEKLILQVMSRVDACMAGFSAGSENVSSGNRSVQLQAATAGLMEALNNVQEAVQEQMEEVANEIAESHFENIAAVTLGGLAVEALQGGGDIAVEAPQSCGDLVMIVDDHQVGDHQDSGIMVEADCYIWGTDRGMARGTWPQQGPRNVRPVRGRQGSEYQGCYVWGDMHAM